MSYDIWTAVDVGNPDGLVDVGGISWNYTSNVAGMWRKAMPGTDGLAGLHGTGCKEAAIAVRIGIDRMERDPEPYRAMNPENGWGDFDHQLQCLRELAEAFERVPLAIVQVSR